MINATLPFAAVSRLPSLEILLVEDNPGDALLAREALGLFGDADADDSRAADARNAARGAAAAARAAGYRLRVVPDGSEAMDFLHRRNGHRDAPRPHLILLDLNLPDVDGLDLLARIKSDPALMSIPVVVLSTSDAPEDIAEAYRRHANCYVTKPIELDDYVRVLKSVGAYWSATVRLPAS
jgi:CheY-like chemotaxis protein